MNLADVVQRGRLRSVQASFRPTLFVPFKHSVHRKLKSRKYSTLTGQLNFWLGPVDAQILHEHWTSRA